MGAGVVAATAGSLPLVQTQGVPSHLKFANPDGIAKPNG
jgi:hypothetical protein